MPIDTAAERAVILERLYDGRQFDAHMALQIQVTLARTQTLALLEILDELRNVRMLMTPMAVVEPKPIDTSAPCLHRNVINLTKGGTMCTDCKTEFPF